MVDFFAVELDTIEFRSERWNSFEFAVNESFFGGIILDNENGRLFGIPVDMADGRLNIVFVVKRNAEFGVRKTVFTGVFDFLIKKMFQN